MMCVNWFNMLYVKIFLLSLIQGLTEFLPVSSSAHLIVFGEFLRINENIEIYQIIVQLASVLAMFIFFRKKIIKTVFTLHEDKNSREFSYKIVLAFMPCAVVGFLLYKYVKAYLYGNLTIAVMLILGGIVFLILDNMKLKPKYNDVDEMTKLSAFKIGMYQILAIVPGVSRSGSTIIGGLLTKLSRKTAVEFSFLLAIPTILIATLYDLYKNLSDLQFVDIKLAMFAFLTTFLISMLVIKWFLDYISNHDFKFLAYYRIILGIVIIVDIVGKLL